MTTANRMTTLADLEIGNPKTILSLTAVTLSGNPASTLDYLLIDEALEAKKVVVEEVSEGGSVPERLRPDPLLRVRQVIPHERRGEMPVKKKDKKGGNNPRIAIYGFIFILMLTILLGGCGDLGGDPCIQHVGIGGTKDPYYYYTGDCGEGVTAAGTKQPTVPYSIHFDNSFLNYSAVKTKD